MGQENLQKSGSLPVLCVDLDGSLVRTDLLAESLLLLLKRNPLFMLLLPFWLLRGRAAFKREIAARVSIDASLLPYNEEVVLYIKRERESGRRIVLATASDLRAAECVAEHLGFFDEIVASDGERNLAGEEKRDVLRQRFGVCGFDYVGDSFKDLPVFAAARKSFVVNPSGSLLARVKREARLERVFEIKTDFWKNLFLAIRPHHWIKNILIFIPYITAHQLTDIPLLLRGLAGVLSFSLCAGAIYLINDLLDLAADRVHPSKKSRPFASGAFPIVYGLPLAGLLLLASGALGLLAGSSFLLVLAAYGVCAVAYSLVIRQVLLLDVFCLAFLYTLRLIAGHAVSGLPYSPWLLAFSMFAFLSLALLKRYVELRRIHSDSRASARERAYRPSDMDQLMNMGATSGYLAALVFALYINSEQMLQFYARPALLWIVCPIILYWFNRIWFLAHRGQVNHDPVVFALQDRVSYITALIMGCILAFASK
ncbi:MAG: UbiA family prenyltransferase [Elusimicrobiota bacterium]